MSDQSEKFLGKLDDRNTALIDKLYQHQRRLRDERNKLREENERLKEAISYLPKVPTEPYERSMAKEITQLREELNKQLDWNLDNFDRIRALETKLTLAREALETIAKCKYDDIGPWLCDHAAKALKELGEKNE